MGSLKRAFTLIRRNANGGILKKIQLRSFCSFGNVNAQMLSGNDCNGLSNVGQATSYSHPHMIKPGEVVPGITKDQLQTRRLKLLETIEAHSPHHLHIVIIPASPKKYMTEKIPYVFRQDTDFMYLSGCLEQDSCLVLTSHRKQHEATLFLRGKDPQAELWDGPRTGTEQACEIFGVDRGLPLNELAQYLRSLLKVDNDCNVWYDYLSAVNPTIYSIVKENLGVSRPIESPRAFIHHLRVRKSPAEQSLMRATCSVGSEALIRTMKISKPGLSEAQLFAKVDFESRMLGAQYLAYPPVVASGPRANTIHYINNNQIVQPGQLVLMDAGCELNSYTSDITRTWPVSGTWSTEQRALYEVLYNVQMKLLVEVERRPSLNQLFHTMCKLLGRGLHELGLIKGKVTCEEDLSKAAYSFCPHHVSHYLGMDVHDTAAVPRDIPLEPGMVFTVEPGIYVNSNNKLANPIYYGLGMRIEDDVLVTENGIEVLTAACPKHPDEIQKIIGT